MSDRFDSSVDLDERVGFDDVDLVVTDLDDESDYDDVDDDYDDVDDLDDATDDDIDFVVALYREDGLPTIVPLDADLANDLDALIAQLQRLPGDAGATGLASINREVLVAVRARGPRHVQVMTSDIYYADVWPIVRDVADYFGVEPGEGETPEDGPFGDLSLFADQGLKEESLEALSLDDEDTGSDEMAERIVRAIRFDSATFEQVIDDYWDGEDDSEDD
ncbi:MAG: tRNA adenosine deaminase [Propionibacteriaceae bacterium]|jgi:putative tRNA adenosine deaminase-associated protein|nr:tRNA adenosine deaminase [Propionibacteriaceae bacterium]